MMLRFRKAGSASLLVAERSSLVEQTTLGSIAEKHVRQQILLAFQTKFKKLHFPPVIAITLKRHKMNSRHAIDTGVFLTHWKILAREY